MTDRTSAPLLTGEMLGQAAATGLAGAALSVDRHPRSVRALSLVLATAAGTWTGLAASGVVARPATDEQPKGEQPAATSEGPASPAKAIALGAGIFALTAGAGEVGIRMQSRFERWAEESFGRPRLAVGITTGALSLAIDVAARAGERRAP